MPSCSPLLSHPSTPAPHPQQWINTPFGSVYWFQLAFLYCGRSEASFSLEHRLGSEDPAGGKSGTQRSQAAPPTTPTAPLTPRAPLFSALSFLPHNIQIPGTRLGDLTPVTSHPGPSGNSQQHFFVRKLTRGEGGVRPGRAAGASGEGGREPRRGLFLLPVGGGWGWQRRAARLPPRDLRPRPLPLPPPPPHGRARLPRDVDPGACRYRFGTRGPKLSLCQFSSEVRSPSYLAALPQVGRVFHGGKIVCVSLTGRYQWGRGTGNATNRKFTVAFSKLQNCMRLRGRRRTTSMAFVSLKGLPQS